MRREFVEVRMSKAIELIVNAYVRLNDRKALADLKAHRDRLAVDLKARADWFELNNSIEQVDEEIEIIMAGLARLDDGDPGCERWNRKGPPSSDPLSVKNLFGMKSRADNG